MAAYKHIWDIMEDLLGELGKGFARGIGYILADIFFQTICFWLGWPVCKTLTLGKYPKPKNTIHRNIVRPADTICSLMGFSILFAIGLYFIGAYA